MDKPGINVAAPSPSYDHACSSSTVHRAAYRSQTQLEYDLIGHIEILCQKWSLTVYNGNPQNIKYKLTTCWKYIRVDPEYFDIITYLTSDSGLRS